MTTSWPGALDALTNPAASDHLDNPPHHTQHANANDAIEALQAHVGVFDFVSLTYAPDRTGASDASTALQSMIDAANAAYVSTGRPQHCYIAAGSYKLTSALATNNGVHLHGAGIDATTFLPYGAVSAFDKFGSSGSPITDVGWYDLGVDGTNQTGTSVATKGLYGQFYRKLRCYRVRVYNTIATGFGIDYIDDGIYAFCEADTCGRGAPGGSTGGYSGFGVGTGAWQYEPLLVTGCRAVNCAVHGIFVEKQSGGGINYLVRGVRIIGNYCEGNYHGLGDKGTDGTVFEGNTVFNSTKAGIYFADGLDGSPSTNTLVIGNTFVGGAGAEGVWLRNVGTGVQVRENRVSGFDRAVLMDGTTGDRLTIEGNDLTGNAKSAIYSDQDFTDGSISRNRIFNNGTNTGASDRAGITLNCSTTRLHIEGNWISDSQGSKTQTYGIDLRTGKTQTDLVIRSNDLRNNLTASFTSASTLVTPWIERNLGYRPGLGSVSPTGSPMTYTAGATPEVLYIFGGTVSSVTRAGTQVANATGCQVQLDPGESCVITYSSDPTLVADAR